MPVRITKIKGSERVTVSTPSGVKSKGTSMAKAKAQTRLLNAIEHGFKPKGRKG